MRDFLIVMGLALLPALANFVGGGLAEVFRVSARGLSLALHLAAGIVLAVVGLELMPEALQADPPWLPLLAFVAGGAVFAGLDAGVHVVQSRFGGNDDRAGAMGVFAGVSMDLFSDGVMIGTGTVVNPALGLLLALGQMPADLPEGFAAVASMRSAGIPRRRRLLFAAGFAVPILVGAALGFLALRDAPEALTLSVLALTGGALVSRRRRGDGERGTRRGHLALRTGLPHRRFRSVRGDLGLPRSVDEDGGRRPAPISTSVPRRGPER